MTYHQALLKIGEQNEEIKMLRQLKNDLLYYNRVVLCRECQMFDKGYCSHWKTEMDKEGYCSYGKR